MFEIRVESEFSAAHFLRDYNGKCENLHGHNYKVFVHVCGKELDSGGMLIDFALLKSALKNVLFELDHTNLNDNPAFDQNPSAERIAVYIYEKLTAVLRARSVNLQESTDEINESNNKKVCPPESKNKSGARNGKESALPDIKITAIDIYETPTSRARYIP